MVLAGGGPLARGIRVLAGPGGNDVVDRSGSSGVQKWAAGFAFGIRVSPAKLPNAASHLTPPLPPSRGGKKCEFLAGKSPATLCQSIDRERPFSRQCNG